MSKKPSRRAAIYIRVSSEPQAEKASPEAQEADCLEYSRKHDYEVVGIYRDTAKYRIGSRLVQPSGTRRDRPEFTKMLRDAESGEFDLIVAWREDRLYRSMRPMLDMLDLIKQGSLDIELVKETFDKKMVGIKASIAEMELDALRERTHMGVKARLRQGKLWGGHLMYGYAREGDKVVLDIEEARWIKKIFEWFTSGTGVRDISRRLIEEGAPAKKGQKQKIRWPMSTIYRILNRECYSTGIHKVRREGEVFDLPIPQIIDPKVFNSAQEKLASNRREYARNVKYPYLLRGILTSPCESSWHAYTRKYMKQWTKKSTGEVHPYEARQSYYRCAFTTTSVENLHHPDCPKTKGVVRLDAWVWDKLAEILRMPDLLTAAADARLRDLKDQYGDASKELKMLERQLEDIESQRALYIEKFGRDNISGGPFSEADLDQALERLSTEEIDLRRRTAELRIVSQTPFNELDQSVADYLSDIATGLKWLDRKPEDDEEAQLQFEERRGIVKALIDRVTIRRNRDPEISFALEIPSIAQFQSLSS